MPPVAAPLPPSVYEEHTRSLVRWVVLVRRRRSMSGPHFGLGDGLDAPAPDAYALISPSRSLTPHESFVPTSVEAFAGDATLETHTAPNAWAVVNSSPSATGLPTSPTAACVVQALVPCYRLNQQACTPAAGVAFVSCYVTNYVDPAQYWYFYYDDFYSYNYPPDDFIWQAHEGDREAVTILVPRGGGTSPVDRLQPALHGRAPKLERCACAARRPCPSRPAYASARAAGVRPTAVVRVTASRPAWMRSAGTWGEYQLFHGPNPLNTIVSGFSPASPPAGTLWRHPVQTVLSWPRSG
jgi:hypothetical protein